MNMKMIATDDMVIEENVMAGSLNTGIGMEEMQYDMMTNGDSAGISSVVILGIVIGVCVILGIALGILSGKRSANK